MVSSDAGHAGSQCIVDWPSSVRTSEVDLPKLPPINMRPPGEAQLPWLVRGFRRLLCVSFQKPPQNLTHECLIIVSYPPHSIGPFCVCSYLGPGRSGKEQRYVPFVKRSSTETKFLQPPGPTPPVTIKTEKKLYIHCILIANNWVNILTIRWWRSKDWARGRCSCCCCGSSCCCCGSCGGSCCCCCCCNAKCGTKSCSLFLCYGNNSIFFHFIGSLANFSPCEGFRVEFVDFLIQHCFDYLKFQIILWDYLITFAPITVVATSHNIKNIVNNCHVVLNKDYFVRNILNLGPAPWLSVHLGLVTVICSDSHQDLSVNKCNVEK